MTLTFDKLRATNVKRCNTAFAHKLEDWSLSDWACAMAGEAGEACDVVKKIRRGDEKLNDLLPSGDALAGEQVLAHDDLLVEGVRDDLAKELADVVCYCDLLAARAGIDLGEAVRQKFNEVSDRCGSALKL